MYSDVCTVCHFLNLNFHKQFKLTKFIINRITLGAIVVLRWHCNGPRNASQFIAYYTDWSIKLKNYDRNRRDRIHSTAYPFTKLNRNELALKGNNTLDYNKIKHCGPRGNYNGILIYLSRHSTKRRDRTISSVALKKKRIYILHISWCALVSIQND